MNVLTKIKDLGQEPHKFRLLLEPMLAILETKKKKILSIKTERKVLLSSEMYW